MVGDVGLCRWECLAFVKDEFVKSGFERRRREAESGFVKSGGGRRRERGESDGGGGIRRVRGE